MPEYISKDKAREIIENRDRGFLACLKTFDEILKLPSESVTEVKKGWIKEPDRPRALRFKCSYCGHYCYDIFYVDNESQCSYKFCPNCGTDMRGEDNG